MRFVKIAAVALNTQGHKWIYNRTFHISWPIWVKFGTDNLHLMPQRTRRFSWK